jgi:hypothetical protein
METKDIDKLKKLNNELIENGCNNFYIHGISKILDDVFCLDIINGKWTIYYSERGIMGEIIYSTEKIEDAINYYKNYIMKMEHRHLILMTRSNKMFNEYRDIIENNRIKIIQNDIPAYNK